MRARSSLALPTAALCLLSTLSACEGCEVFQPTNPFDPLTPADLQAPGHVIGRVKLDGRDFDALPVVLRVVDEGGRAVERAGEPVVVNTRKSADDLPAGFVDDELGAAGTFDVELAPGTYTLVFNAAENTAAQFFDAAIDGIVV